MIKIMHKETGEVLYEIDGREFHRRRMSFSETYSLDLRGVNLSGARFSEFDLRSVDFRDADLSEAVFYNADLRSADLRGANLRGASLWKADLVGTKFNESQIPEIIEALDIKVMP